MTLMLVLQRAGRFQRAGGFQLLRMEILRRRPRGFSLRAEYRLGGWARGLKLWLHGLRETLRLLECLRRALINGPGRCKRGFDDLRQTLWLRLRLEHLRRALGLRLHKTGHGRTGRFTLRTKYLRIRRTLAFTLRVK